MNNEWWSAEFRQLNKLALFIWIYLISSQFAHIIRLALLEMGWSLVKNKCS